jgi:predicted O-methyltransferase YrrM
MPEDKKESYPMTEDEAQAYLKGNGCSALLSAGAAEEIAPKWDDLARLHKFVRQRKPFTILEFGSGFSTVVMAHALQQNWSEYQELPGRQAAGGADLPAAENCVT